ncbi:sugar phosphate isomerase/epimerase [Thermostilla marina]
MILGYNTNGFAHHDPSDAVAILGELGYRAVGLTIDHNLLSPYGDWSSQAARIRRALQTYDMRCVIETGARYLLDPRLKHEPTLITPDPQKRRRRIAFYEHAFRCAAELGADCVSVWSGIDHADDPKAAWRRLTEGVSSVLALAEKFGIPIGFEPEPGMLVATVADYRRLKAECDSPLLRLTLDIGHVVCNGEGDPATVIRACAPELVNIHIEDMKPGVHEHLPFGEGVIEFPPVLQALLDSGYDRGVYVELSRDSHRAPEIARLAKSFLTSCLESLNK